VVALQPPSTIDPSSSASGDGHNIPQIMILPPLAPPWAPLKHPSHSGDTWSPPAPGSITTRLRPRTPGNGALTAHLSERKMSLAHVNPDPGSETAPRPSPIVDITPNRGPFDGPLLSRGAIRIRLAWAKRRDTTHRRMNNASNQSMLVNDWPTLRLPSLPVTEQIRAFTPLLPGNLHTFSWRPDPNYKIRHDPPVRAEYPFEYSPPHSPLGNLDSPSAGSGDQPCISK
jgi:hypothetical protein